MQYEEQQELLEAFSELRAIGQDLAAKFNDWNENNLDDDKSIAPIMQDMSGDSVVMQYTENGFTEGDVAQIIASVGFSVPEESDDTIGIEEKTIKSVDEHLSDFLSDCIAIANSYPYFVKDIELQSGCEKDKDEVRIILPSDNDFRKLPHINAKKVMFMHFLKDIREVERKHSMIDESMCFCAHKQEFWIIIRSLTRKRK